MRQVLQRLYQLFSHEDRLLILIDADPDSMASAWALKRLLWRRLSHIVISHIRPITRPQNERMVRLLGIPSLPLERVHPEEFNRKAIVDSQPSHHANFKGHTYDVIIDHHPLLPDSTARLVDIRPEYGATSTILTEYLRAARIKPSIRLATALYYGIKTDTSNFERPAIEADVRAFHYLFSYIRKPLVRRLEFAELKLDMLPYYQTALRRYRVRGNRLSAPDQAVRLTACSRGDRARAILLSTVTRRIRHPRRPPARSCSRRPTARSPRRTRSI